MMVQSNPPVVLTMWQIDPKHSTVQFAVRHMMVSKVRGSFAGVEGAITMDGEDLTLSSVQATLDATSVDTREAQRDGHLRSADFLDAERYPKVTFKSTGIEQAGDAYRIVGDLTIRSVTQAMALEATFEGQHPGPWGGERAGFSARGQIDRRDFGLTYNQVLETGGLVIGNDVWLSIEIEGVRLV